jgi:hypothetical protein
MTDQPTTETGRRLVKDTNPQSGVDAFVQDILDIEVEAKTRGVEHCIYIVQQSLDTVRAEDDGESRSIRTSIAAREHVISLLAGYRAGLAEPRGCGCDGEHCGDGPTCAYVVAGYDKTIERLREQVRMLGRVAETALTPDGSHRLIDGYCPDCQGGCMLGFVEPVSFVGPDPFAS